MFIRIRILSTLCSTVSLLLLVLCLGSQNINNRSPINLGFSSMAPLPTGFIVGVSIILGFISGGSTASLVINNEYLEEVN